MMMNENWDFVITEKKDSALFLITYFIPGVLFSVLAADQFLMKPNKSVILGICFAFIAIVSIRSFAVTCIKFFCCRLCIGKNGFYFQSNPFNGKYYKYKDIVKCSTNKNTSYNRRRRSSFCEYWFVFRDKNGNKMKYKFNKARYSYEINELMQRIGNAKNAAHDDAAAEIIEE